MRHRLKGALVIVAAMISALGFVASVRAAGTPADAFLGWDTTSTGPRRFLAVHGRRALIAGYSNNGLEVWAYPFQIVNRLGVGFRPAGTTTETDGSSVLRRITYNPESVTRTYIGPDYVIREKLFVPLDLPAAILSYEVDSRSPVDVVIHFTPVLNLMWPASIGGQETTWRPELSGYVISEPTQQFSAIIYSPNIIAHDGTANVAQQLTPDRPKELSFTLRAGVGHNVTVVIAEGMPKDRNAASLAARVLAAAAALEGEAANHYSSILNENIRIETPDPVVDRALAWSEIALDQAWVCDKGIGCAFVAGYGPSRRARRPQYDWFFAGDGLVAMQALLSMGDFARARQELQFILQFQNARTGMIWHELSQSAPYLDWAGKYPYMYVHVDVSFDFISAVANYVAATGDQGFVTSNWPSIARAYEYCLSVINSQDGLPRIARGKEGGNEQRQLSDELRLSASWVAAAEGYAELATLTGHSADAVAALAAAKKARTAIAARYWSAKDKFWISGYTRSGTPFIDKGLGSISAVEQRLFTQPQLDLALEQVAASDYQTDWGTRSVPRGVAEYDPNSYASGSVWAIGTASAASAFWSQHQPDSAYSIWSTLPQWTALDSLGHMHEAAAGNFYHEQLESVPEQTWSSSSFLTAAVHGLLGLNAKTSGLIAFSPHLPSAWNSISIRNIRLRGSVFDAGIGQSEDNVTLDLLNHGDAFRLLFAPEIPLGARILSARLGNKPVKVSAQKNAADEHASVDIVVPTGNTHLTIRYTGGVSLLPTTKHVLVGDPSSGVRIIKTALSGDTYKVLVDFKPGPTSTIQFRTAWRVRDVQGAAFRLVRPDIYALDFSTVPVPGDPQPYRRATAVIRFAGR